MQNSRSHRIMGFTSIQLVILICMACAAFGVLGVGFWVVVSGAGLGIGVQPATATVPPVLTSTFVPTATATFTPTATLIPYDAFIPQGWRQYRNDQLEIWLPTDFPVESNEEYIAAMVQGLRQLGQDDQANEMEQNPPVYDLAFHRATSSQYIETSLYLLGQQSPGVSGLSDFIDERLAHLPPTHMVVERKDFEMFRAAGERITIQANFNGSYIGYVYYFTQDDDVIWEIGGTAVLDEFYAVLPTLDKIAKTFRSVH